MASLAKWFSVRLQTKWLWVRISLVSLSAIVFQGHQMEASQRNDGRF